jgi:hypothetical protein
MSKKRRSGPERWMKPVFLVFCEAETEEAYVNFLRQKYRLPVKVIPYITGLNISPKLIKNHIASEQIHKHDAIKSFLMYDLDVEGISEKIAACKGSVSIASNPCIELWFLLHHVEQRTEIKTSDCITALQKAPDWSNYKKGMFSSRQKQILWETRKTACERAKILPEASNPSSAVFLLIEAMEKVKN